ncbi:NAD(P)H-dependent oxidoreductase [Enterococcus sp. 669A]|uniref:NAD(P)H-dependent oxidoreductase n=1 Tax=Candidatus Enterococcus moelleringii TaxID=2815325 RepID=A0ABS3LE20_9ENTE|nr:NAD(P)H-dependent oxidoreductase [Enterococcus sp. 669A]MBO1307881.1 NAD(P)H-dependent oxidoreductase [Enterococcus sp. 669A]
MTDQAELRNEILAVHKRRFATKAFDPTKTIAEEDWMTIMEAARLSPSSFGYEPWKFLLVESQQVKDDLQDVAWGARNSLNGASHFLIVLARKNLTGNSPHVKHMVEDVFGVPYSKTSPQTIFFNNFQKDDFGLTDERSLFDWASKQTYLPLANMMTTAAYLGIDSVPIEGFNKEAVENYLAEKNIIDLDEFGVSYMAGFGYRAQEVPEKKRQNLSDIYDVIK